MLDHLSNDDVVINVIEAQGVNPFLSTILGSAAVAVGELDPFVWPFLIFEPDITFPYRTLDDNSDQIKETFYHEFAHASHFFLQPPDYWLNNIKYVVKNNKDNNNSPYGTFTTPESGRTAVIELWGEHYGKTLADRQYGLEHSNTTSTDMEFRTKTRHIFQLERFMPNSSLSSPGISDVADNWIPYGVFHDCLDNNSLNPTGVTEPTIVTDGVMGYSQAQFFASLANANNIATVKTRLGSSIPAGQTAASVGALFGTYGY